MPAKPKKSKSLPTEDQKHKLFDDPETETIIDPKMPKPTINTELLNTRPKEESLEVKQIPEYIPSRGSKQCPSCYKKIGARSTTCPECGHEFQPKDKDKNKTPKVRMGFNPHIDDDGEEETPQKGTSEDGLIKLLGNRGIPVEIVAKWDAEKKDIVREIKIGGKGSKHKFLTKDKAILDSGEILLNAGSSQARVEMSLDMFLALI